jgi:predicted dehydrogenase
MVPDIDVVSIGSTPNGKERLKALSEKYSIAEVYYDSAELINSTEADVIYVAVPNHLHYKYVKLALLCGKSVICEKPFCSNIDELRELIKIADERGLYLFEAISNQYYPNYDKVRELLPYLGDIKLVEMNYTQYSRRYAAFRAGEMPPVFDISKSGGVLMDLNVYNIHFIVGLFGKPNKVSYAANIIRSVDTSGALVMKYPGFVATAIAAKDCCAPCRISIQGDKGYIFSESPSNVFDRFVYCPLDGEPKSFVLNNVEPSQRLYYELRVFCDMIASNDMSLCKARLAQSLTVQQILDEARDDAGIAIIKNTI